jgi:hypothetical protein
MHMVLSITNGTIETIVKPYLFIVLILVNVTYYLMVNFKFIADKGFS